MVLPEEQLLAGSSLHRLSRVGGVHGAFSRLAPGKAVTKVLRGSAQPSLEISSF